MKLFLRNKRTIRIAVLIPVLLGIPVILYWHWNPGPSSMISFDKKTNGIWAGHQWFTGRNVTSGDTVTVSERDQFIEQLRSYGITTVFVHAGPICHDGSIVDLPSPFFSELQKVAPEILFLPWIGGDVKRYNLTSSQWRAALISTIWKLQRQGIKGIHLDIEPLTSFHPGYLELLKELRTSLEKDFYISHATKRVAPVEVPFWPVTKYFWTKAFYISCMKYTDQTVLMGYDTRIRLKKIYTASIAMQTKKLTECSAEFPHHSFMIGIPTYGDNPSFHDPKVENIQTAVSGVRAALEIVKHNPASFEGVALYAHWTTKPHEWRWYEVYWMQRY
jgi:hypothetical protein